MNFSNNFFATVSVPMPVSPVSNTIFSFVLRSKHCLQKVYLQANMVGLDSKLVNSAPSGSTHLCWYMKYTAPLEISQSFLP